jgi:glutamate 5-kinase
MRRAALPGSPIVIKVGSSSLAHDGGGIDPAAVRRVVRQVEEVRALGHPTVLVSSGAVAAGLPDMGLQEPPADLAGLQVAAAVGQGRLMRSYADEFGVSGTVIGQVLLTRDVLANRGQYLHAREALSRMLELAILPIVNENDTVVVDELRFGDNDRLAAIVSHLVGAGMLVILTDTVGLFSQDPRLSEKAEFLSAVRHTDEILDEIDSRSGVGVLGSGGVVTKVSAARMAAWSGIPTVIAGANTAGAAAAAVGGEDIGTWVEPHESGLSAKKLWIAFGLPVQGRIMADDGAIAAIVGRGASLLAVGVSLVEGDFDRGAAVDITDASGSLVAKGRVGISAEDLHELPNPDSSDVGIVIHRDDLVVFV